MIIEKRNHLLITLPCEYISRENSDVKTDWEQHHDGYELIRFEAHYPDGNILQSTRLNPAVDSILPNALLFSFAHSVALALSPPAEQEFKSPKEGESKWRMDSIFKTMSLKILSQSHCTRKDTIIIRARGTFFW